LPSDLCFFIDIHIERRGVVLTGSRIVCGELHRVSVDIFSIERRRPAGFWGKLLEEAESLSFNLTLTRSE
jgi:hypothetical protein